MSSVKLIGEGQPPKEKPKQIPKLESRLLKYDFSLDELVEMGDQTAKMNQELSQVKEQMKSEAANYKAKIAALESKIGLFSDKIANKSEQRMLDVVIHYHVPREAVKTITRMDSGLSWEEKMTTEEWNLFNQEQRRQEKEMELQEAEEIDNHNI